VPSPPKSKPQEPRSRPASRRRDQSIDRADRPHRTQGGQQEETNPYLGYSPFQTGLRYLPITLSVFLFSAIAGGLIGRVPARLLMSAGLSLIGFGLLLMSGIAAGSDWTTLRAGFLVAGIGTAAPAPTMTTGCKPDLPCMDEISQAGRLSDREPTRVSGSRTTCSSARVAGTTHPQPAGGASRR
jgi:hypothetical protein